MTVREEPTRAKKDPPLELLCRTFGQPHAKHIEVQCETASQLLTQVCELFRRSEEDTCLLLDKAVVWVAGSDKPDVPLSDLSLSPTTSVFLDAGKGLQTALRRAGEWGEHGRLPGWAWEERSVVLAAVRTGGLDALQRASEALRRDPEVRREAARRYALQYAGHDLGAARQERVAVEGRLKGLKDVEKRLGRRKDPGVTGRYTQGNVHLCDDSGIAVLAEPLWRRRGNAA
eukprot:Rhum_TRINITY_DN14895_c0_g1::Rhum_TRINITY_DN14895_c0_g1_i1::g.125125::m.125125